MPTQPTDTHATQHKKRQPATVGAVTVPSLWPDTTSIWVRWDTECYRGIKPMAEGHPKPRIGSEEDTSNIASPLV